MMTRPLAFHFSLNRPWMSLRCARLDTFLPWQMASRAKQRIDFHALEAKWCNRWHNRGIDTQNNRQSPSSLLPALTPFYLPHLRRLSSILEILEYHHAKTRSGNLEITVIDRVFQLVPTKLSDLRQFVQSHGADVVRTALLFSDRTTGGVSISETDIELIQKWFELVKKAVLIAHGSYISTQKSPDSPVVPEALYEANLESWDDYIDAEHLEYVQVPPEEPDMSGESTDTEEYRLWLVAQKSILSYITPITSRNSTRRIKSRLVQLSKAIIAYDKASLVCCNMHYYAARILVSLLAPLAPSFAEECWVHLHYGDQSSDRDGSDSPWDFDECLREEIEEIIKETEENYNRRHLPRQGQPSTLQSIFDQPFPVVRLPV
ncbi:hypothetical protein F5Y09DRAFT_352716 [Xylaria sp. FL1042]|nr:hypothetical protein F5Y09DRAFT_352716 [Xylaria sp. FL1042]